MKHNSEVKNSLFLNTIRLNRAKSPVIAVIAVSVLAFACYAAPPAVIDDSTYTITGVESSTTSVSVQNNALLEITGTGSLSNAS